MPDHASVFRWNQLDIGIVALSIMGITLEELKLSAALPINPTIIRIMRVLRIARGGTTQPRMLMCSCAAILEHPLLFTNSVPPRTLDS